MILGVNHITLSVPSLEVALGFEQVATMSWASGSKTSHTARQIIGISGTSADAVHLRTPNLVLEILQCSGCNIGTKDPARPLVDHGITYLCLAVTDLDAECQRLQNGGMTFHGVPTKVAPGVRSVYGRDPLGNVIEREEAAGRVNASASALGVVKGRVFDLALANLAPAVRP